MIQENKRCVRKLVELLWRQGTDSLAKLLLDKNFVYYGSRPAKPMNAEAYLAYVRNIRECMTDIEVAIEEMVCEGDTVMVHFSFCGIVVKPLLGFPPSDRVLTLPVISIYHMRHGRVKDLMTVYDVLAVQQQLLASASKSETWESV